MNKKLILFLLFVVSIVVVINKFEVNDNFIKISDIKWECSKKKCVVSFVAQNISEHPFTGKINIISFNETYSYKNKGILLITEKMIPSTFYIGEIKKFNENINIKKKPVKILVIAEIDRKHKI